MSASASRPAPIVQRILIAALMVAIVATALSGAAMMFLDPSDRTAALFLGAPAIVALCLGLLVVYGAVLRRQPGPLVRLAIIAGAIIAPLATGIILLLILAPPLWVYDNETTLAQAGSAGLAIAIALAYTGALASVRSRSWLITAMALATGACAWLAAGLLILILFVAALDLDHDFDTILLLAAVFGILLLLTLTGTIAVPIAVASKASKRREAAESLDARVQVHFGCPKCGARQTQRPGFVKCNGCGAGMFIEIEEPRCECGYLLYQLTGANCPECGRTVVDAAQERSSAVTR